MKRRFVWLVLTLLVVCIIWVAPANIARAGTYADKILALNPIAYWKLDETSGTTAYDSSGNHYDGTYYGVTLDQIDGPGSTMGRAGLWDGINDYVNVFSAPLASAIDTDHYTVVLWFRAASADMWGTGYHLLFDMVRSANNHYSNIANFNDANHLSVRRYAGTIQSEGFSENRVGEWIFAAITVDVSANKLYGYRDDDQSSVSSATGTFETITSADIGGRATLYGSPAYIQHVAYYNYALNQTTLNDLSNPNIPATPTPTATTTSTNTPRPPQLISTLQNGNQWELDYTITAGQIGLFIPILLFIGFFIFYMILKLVKK